jgi:ATP-binding cassette subfamily B protein
VVGILWYGAELVIAGEITGGRLGQFVLYALFAAGALAELSEVWGEVTQAAGATERLAELLETEPEIVLPARPLALPEPPRGRIDLERVGFVYPGRGESPALQDISLTVAPGERVALVGPSGSGKSTLLALVQRLRDPTAGRILIDGVPAREASLDVLRRRMALVPQDITLLAGTVAENIRFGAEDAGMAEVEHAATAAQADAFIRALPEGYETRIGERGITLSGGQRQRIAIARALLRAAPILLLVAASRSMMLCDANDGTTAPAGKPSTAYACNVALPPRVVSVAADTLPAAISTAASGGGLFSQDSSLIRRRSPC